MRRPLKPFVTEYRGGSRRSAHPGPAPGHDLFKSEPPSNAPAWTPPVPSEPAEDSYEAALRAADALFSANRAPAAAVPAAATPSSATPSPAKPSPSAPQPTIEAAPATPTTGRILRVLDEPPTAEMLEMERLEAEHAPKKRGRKPGSKNKPKVAALEAVPAAAAAPTAPPSEAPPVAPVPTAAVLAARAIASAPRRTEPAAPGERFAWVRTRLKPGQQWKRRLPKVAW